MFAAADYCWVTETYWLPTDAPYVPQRLPSDKLTKRIGAYERSKTKAANRLYFIMCCLQELRCGEALMNSFHIFYLII